MSATGLEKTIKIVDSKGKVLAELQKIVKDVTVEEFKKMLVSFKPFRKCHSFTYLPYHNLTYSFGSRAVYLIIKESEIKSAQRNFIIAMINVYPNLFRFIFTYIP